MTPAQTAYKHLDSRPESFYRQLFVKGTKIMARTLYGWHVSAEEPMTPEEIAEAWELPLEAVQEAIAYCQSNPPEIVQDFAREEALAEAMGQNDPDYKRTGKTRLLSPQELHRILSS